MSTMKTAASSSPPSPPASKRQKNTAAEEESEKASQKSGDQNELLALRKIIEERDAALKLAEQQLADAKEAAPALFAKPGDKFSFYVWSPTDDYFDAALEYVGRNTTPPKKVTDCFYTFN